MILFFGPPGSGKSVQGQLLVSRNGWKWLSTGELFRASKDPQILECLATGELIADDLTNKVLSDALNKFDSDNGIVLDGYPRNTNQAKWLMKYLGSHFSEIEAIVVFEVENKELIRRLSGRGRDEDKLEVITRRHEIYHEQTQPVLDFYESQGLPIYRVNGEGEPKVVHERVQAALEKQKLV